MCTTERRSGSHSSEDDLVVIPMAVKVCLFGFGIALLAMFFAFGLTEIPDPMSVRSILCLIGAGVFFGLYVIIRLMEKHLER